MNRFNSELPKVELPEEPKRSWFTVYHLWGYAFLALAFLLAIGFIYQMEYGRKPDENKICILVVTTARSPYSGETRDFPTPCDVPEGWEVVPGVYNEIPNIQIENNSESVGSESNKSLTGGYSNDVYMFELQFPNTNSYLVEELDAGGHSLINFCEFVNPDGAARFSVELIAYASMPNLELKDLKYKNKSSVGITKMAGQDANIYFNKETVCEQDGCQESFISYATKNTSNNYFYVLTFYGVDQLSIKEKTILDSFKFVK